MRCIGLRLLNCRFWQPARLAVALVPLAVLSCCAAAGQWLGDGEQQILAADRAHNPSSVGGHSDRELTRPSTTLRHSGGIGSSSTEREVGVVLKAAWPPSKSHVSRRGGERWGVVSRGSLAAMPPGLMASAGPMSKGPSVLSAEYALLRRLEL